MKIIKISLIFYFTIISFQSYSQTIQKSEFTIELLNEDFESENNYFPTTTDYDTYLLVDNGDYLVSRNINKSQFIKLNIGAVKDYSLETSIRIGPSKNSSSGIVLSANEKNMLVFEINGKREYRIFKSYNDETKFLTDEKNNGWVKTKKLKRADRINKISVLKSGDNFEFYFNEYFILSKTIAFENSELMGIHINGNSKARYGFFKLMSNKVVELIDNNQLTTEINDKLDETSIDGNNSVINFKSNNLEIENQKKQIDELSQNALLSSEKISALKSQIDEMSQASLIANQKIRKLENELELKSQDLMGWEVSFNDLNEKVKESNKIISNLKKEKNDLSDKNSKFINEIEDLSKKIGSLESEKKSLNSEVIDISNSLASSKKSSDDLNKNLKNLNAQLKKLKDVEKKFKVCEKSVLKLSSQIKDLESRIQVLDKSKTQLENENKMQAMSQNKLINEKNNLQETITSLKESNDELNKTLSKKRNDYLKLKDAFVYMEFEKNGIESMKDAEMKTKDVIVDHDKKNNVKVSYFTVNLGVLLTPKSNKFRDAPDLWIMNNENNTFSYMSKKFNNMNEATEHMNNLTSAGYRDLSVVKID